MTSQSFVRNDHDVVVVQSAGGWDSLAFISENRSNVRAAITFDGGRGDHFRGRSSNNCHPGQLVDATRAVGRTVRTATLWIYTKNDSDFGPALSKQMFEAWEAAAGNAKYHRHQHLRHGVAIYGKRIVCVAAPEILFIKSDQNS